MSAFFTLYTGLYREGPGEPADVAWAAELAGLEPDARICDAGCGSGADIPALLATAPKGRVTAVDSHAPFIEALRIRTGEDRRVTAYAGNMAKIKGPFDLIWSAGALYFLGTVKGLKAWRPALAKRGAVAFSEPCFFTDQPSRHRTRVLGRIPGRDRRRRDRRAGDRGRVPDRGHAPPVGCCLGGLLPSARGSHCRSQPRRRRRDVCRPRRGRGRDRGVARRKGRDRVPSVGGPPGMSLQACAELVRRGDPDRFLAAMAAPPQARTVLFPLYAFNVEVARAPWVTEEPMIAEMRMQWWRDALAKIAHGGPVRRHEVVEPLAAVLDGDGVKLLDRVVEMRRWDIYRDPFEDDGHFTEYLDATAGNLSWAAARALGATEGEAALRDAAWAGGLANWFLAIPDLKARGRKPLPDGRPAAVRALAIEGLARLARARLGGPGRYAALWTWRARALLSQARRHPARVAEGRLGQSEFVRRGSLLLRSLRR